MTGHMRYQRLLLEYGSLAFTLSLHQRLTVISGVGPQEREGLVGELLGAMTGTRRGIRLVGVTLSNLEPTVGAHDQSHGLLRGMASLDAPTAVFEGARDGSGG